MRSWLLLVVVPVWQQFYCCVEGSSNPGASTYPDLGIGKLSLRNDCTEQARTCKNCHEKFLPSQNSASCRYHTGFFSGETRQRWQDPGNPFIALFFCFIAVKLCTVVFEGHKQLPGETAGDVVFHWWCCAQSDERAPGCAYKMHESYD